MVFAGSCFLGHSTRTHTVTFLGSLCCLYPTSTILKENPFMPCSPIPDCCPSSYSWPVGLKILCAGEFKVTLTTTLPKEPTVLHSFRAWQELWRVWVDLAQQMVLAMKLTQVIVKQWIKACVGLCVGGSEDFSDFHKSWKFIPTCFYVLLSTIRQVTQKHVLKNCIIIFDMYGCFASIYVYALHLSSMPM